MNKELITVKKGKAWAVNSLLLAIRSDSSEDYKEAINRAIEIVSEIEDSDEGNLDITIHIVRFGLN